MTRPSAQEWESRLHREIPVTLAMDVRVTRLDAETVELTASLAANHNDKGTGFAGSLFTVAVLSGWSQVMLMVRDAALTGEVVVSDTQVRYLKPARGDFRALAARPDDETVVTFVRQLRSRGRARLPLSVEVRVGDEAVMVFEGRYAALVR